MKEDKDLKHYHHACAVTVARYEATETLAIFVISVLPLACIWPMSDFYSKHRDFMMKHILLHKRARRVSICLGLLMLAASHAILVGLLSFIPWEMEDLNAGDILAFIGVAGVLFVSGMIVGLVTLIGSEIFASTRYVIFCARIVQSIL